MIAVYLDESGQESKGHVVIAGFFGSQNSGTLSCRSG